MPILVISDYTLAWGDERGDPYWHCSVPRDLPEQALRGQYCAAIFVHTGDVMEARYAHVRDLRSVTAMLPRICSFHEVAALLEALCVSD